MFYPDGTLPVTVARFHEGLFTVVFTVEISCHHLLTCYNPNEGRLQTVRALGVRDVSFSVAKTRAPQRPFPNSKPSTSNPFASHFRTMRELVHVQGGGVNVDLAFVMERGMKGNSGLLGVRPTKFNRRCYEP